MIKAEHISKSYRQGFFSSRKQEVVSDLSFHMKKGTTFGLLGSSGCGKSTVARMIMGILKPEKGQILIEGTDPQAMDRKTRGQIMQMIFQQPEESFDPEMRLGKSIAEPMEVNEIGTAAERKGKIEVLMEQLNLPMQILNRYPHQISGGEAQRLAIIRALTLEPQILLLDEPTSMLDVSTQAQILNILKELQKSRGLTYLFITHDAGVARWMCDEIAVMEQGRIIEYGPTEQVFAEPKEKWTKELLFSWQI